VCSSDLEIAVSISFGPAPGYKVDTETNGTVVSGKRLTGRRLNAIIPVKSISNTRLEMKTGLSTEILGRFIAPPQKD
jgi:hypothetical protein